MAIGFCVKCRAKREIAGGKETILKNKRRALMGHCPKCGTKIIRFLPSK